MAAPHTPAPRTKGRPTLDQAGQIDRLIHEAALDVLREHGEAATLNAVAQAAGLSRKSLYARYPTKAALFLAVMRHILATAEAICFTRGASFEDSLHNYISTGLDSIVGPGAQAIQRMMLLNPDYIATLRQEMTAAMQTIFADPLRQLLRDAAAAGEIAIEDEASTVEAIIKLLVFQDAAANHGGRPADPAWTQRQAQFLTRFICHGLSPR